MYTYAYDLLLALYLIRERKDWGPMEAADGRLSCFLNMSKVVSTGPGSRRHGHRVWESWYHRMTLPRNFTQQHKERSTQFVDIRSPRQGNLPIHFSRHGFEYTFVRGIWIRSAAYISTIWKMIWAIVCAVVRFRILHVHLANWCTSTVLHARSDLMFYPFASQPQRRAINSYAVLQRNFVEIYCGTRLGTKTLAPTAYRPSPIV